MDGATNLTELLQEKTGTCQIDIYPSGQLVNRRILRGSGHGALEFSLVSGAVLERYDPRAEVVQLSLFFMTWIMP